MDAQHVKVITGPDDGPPTLDVLGRFVGIVFDDYLDEVHALNDKALENDPLAGLGEHVADGELQRALNEGYERPRVIFQEIQQLRA